MLKYVVQEHIRQGADLHWDLMWEHGETLKTFRLDRPLHEILHGPAVATPIFDHDKRFLTYEGPVNQNLGTVRIEDSGTLEVLSAEENGWDLKFNGRVLKGQFYLRQIEGNVWEFGYRH